MLKYNQTLMSWQGIHSMNLTEPTNEFHLSPASYYVTFTLFAFVITSAVRIYGYWPEIELILKPCSVAFGGVQCVGMFICIGCQMKNIKALHLKLQRIIDEGICHVFLIELLWKQSQIPKSRNNFHWLSFCQILRFLIDFRTRRWYRWHLLECREKVPKVHSTNSIVFLCERKHFSHRSAVFIV